MGGRKISAMLPKSRKKSFNNGIVRPAKIGGCKKCSVEKCPDSCSNQTDGNKEFVADFYLLKRQAPNRFYHMLPYQKLYLYCQLFVLVPFLYAFIQLLYF